MIGQSKGLYIYWILITNEIFIQFIRNGVRRTIDSSSIYDSQSLIEFGIYRLG